jgi:hypothetical protein
MDKEIPVKGGSMDLQADLLDAFSTGLKAKFGPTIGELMSHVIAYRYGERLTAEKLVEAVESDAGAVLNGIVTNHVDGGTLRSIRACAIGSALLDDREAVARWATEGFNRCQQTKDGEWTATIEQWQWILQNAYTFVYYARQVKRAFNAL